MEVRAISLQQPWANWVAEGKKTIETRKWPTKHRGQLLIVSSKKPDIAPAGYALALVNVVECRPMTVEDEGAACVGLYAGAWAWELEDIRKIEPFPVRGSLGLYLIELPEEMESFPGLI